MKEDYVVVVTRGELLGGGDVLSGHLFERHVATQQKINQPRLIGTGTLVIK